MEEIPPTTETPVQQTFTPNDEIIFNTGKFIMENDMIRLNIEKLCDNKQPKFGIEEGIGKFYNNDTVVASGEIDVIAVYKQGHSEELNKDCYFLRWGWFTGQNEQDYLEEQKDLRVSKLRTAFNDFPILHNSHVQFENPAFFDLISGRAASVCGFKYILNISHPDGYYIMLGFPTLTYHV